MPMPTTKPGGEPIRGHSSRALRVGDQGMEPTLPDLMHYRVVFVHTMSCSLFWVMMVTGGQQVLKVPIWHGSVGCRQRSRRCTAISSIRHQGSLLGVLRINTESVICKYQKGWPICYPFFILTVGSYNLLIFSSVPFRARVKRAENQLWAGASDGRAKGMLSLFGILVF